MNIQAAIEALLKNQDLSHQQMESVMNSIMTGETTDAQIAGFLVALRLKGETVEEITAAAKVMHQLVAKVHVTGPHLIDIVGTGGDSAHTFNISTASAIVVAAAGGKTAKHGNRSVSSSSGSADVLEVAGVNLDLTPEQIAQCVNQINLGFMFAVKHHTAMKYAVGPRKELGIRTIFNLLGPLTNPANTKRQLVGVYDKKWLRPFAEVFKLLGSEHALIVHSEDGLDEISVAAPTFVCELKDDSIQEYSIAPKDFGIKHSELTEFKVASAEQSLDIINQVFNHKLGAAHDIIALNAGAAIYAAGLVDSINSGVEKAIETIKSGKAKLKFEELIKLTNEF